MTAPDTETYTAALTRLADERATGLLTSADADGIAVLLRDGRTAMIGPHDGPPPRDDAPVSRATAVEVLVAQLVSGVTASATSWFFFDGDDGTGHALIEVPAGLPAEVARRTMPDVETRAPLSTAPSTLGTAGTAGTAGTLGTAGTADATPDTTRPVVDETSEMFEQDDFDDGPELWVMGGEQGDTLGDSVEPSPPTAAVTRTSAGVASDVWADTSWLDDLSPAPTQQPGSNPEPNPDPRPVATRNTTTSDDRADVAAEFAGLRGSPEAGDVPAATAANTPVADSHSEPAATRPTTAQRPRPRPEDVSEFLRELSRLALDDGS
jgi:hypothetical protein